MLRVFFLSCLFVSLSPLAHGTILFIDTNNAPLEIAQVDKHLTVTVLPSYQAVSRERRAELENTNLLLGREREAYLRQTRNCQLRNITSEDDCSTQFNLDGFKSLVADHVEQLHVLRNRYDGRKLEDELLNLVRSGASHDLTGIVISGHQANGDVYGELVPMKSLESFTRFFTQHAKSFPNVRSLSLLACNAGTAQAIVKWAELLPSLKLVIGADGKAPIKTDSRNLAFIETMSAQLADFERSGFAFDLSRKSRFQTRLEMPGWTQVSTLWLDPTRNTAIYMNRFGPVWLQ